MSTSMPVPLPDRAQMNASPTPRPPDVPEADPSGLRLAPIEPRPLQQSSPLSARRPRSKDLKAAAQADGKADSTADRMVTAPIELPTASTVPMDSPGSPATQTLPSTAPSRKSSAAVEQVLALSGQMPRRVDSIPPAESGVSKKAVPGNFAESPNPVDSSQLRGLPAGTPDAGEVAFVVRTMAVPTSKENVRPELTTSQPAAEGSRRILVSKEQVGVPAPEPIAASENRPSPLTEPNQAPTRAGRERRVETAPFERPETHAVIPTGKIVSVAALDAPVKAESTPQRAEAAEAKPVSPKDAIEVQTKPEPAKATVVRDMKFEVVGVDRRVEVRLSERHGEMKMTVRTPDTNLASTLRENLPALSTRLAESGFKSETWHPPASSTSEWQHTAESSKGGTFQDSNTPPREHHQDSQDGGGQQHPKRPQEPVAQQKKGRDFAWLMSSLR